MKKFSQLLLPLSGLTIRTCAPVLYLALCGIFACAPGLNTRKKQYVGSEQFERMKSLVGVWEGKIMEKPEEMARVEYTIQSDGQTLEEKLSSPNFESRSVYSDHSGKPSFKYYGDYPLPTKHELRVTKEDSLTFMLAIGSGIKLTDRYLREFTITFLDDDHIIERQIIFEQRQSKDVITLKLTRIREIQADDGKKEKKKKTQWR